MAVLAPEDKKEPEVSDDADNEDESGGAGDTYNAKYAAGKVFSTYSMADSTNKDTWESKTGTANVLYDYYLATIHFYMLKGKNVLYPVLLARVCLYGWSLT